MISESPKVLLERIEASPGVLLSARSSGVVICCSISSEARPLTWVVTCTVTSPRSG
ncbi:Uncharacterised protein [Mycobacterium tuberculosis]|nr:Uncharacterised protein [Mycobacterium tuberculosis]